MIPVQFDYKSPATLDEAVALLASDLDGAKVLAGGHSLIPAMKLRLAQPQLLVDIARIKSLAYIREEGDQILIGATTTHYQLESSDLLKQICPLLPECAKSIGDVQVRNKGTIGGSIAHSDPAGDWPAAVLAPAEEYALQQRRLALLEHLAQGEADIAAGRVHTQEEIDALIQSCFKSP